MGVKQAMCHTGSLLFAILGALSILYCPAAAAQTGAIDQESDLKSPVALRPYSTIGVFIVASDVRGGTGANFVVDWAATGEIAEPALEAPVVGGVGAGQYAFISQGGPIRVVRS